MCLAAAPFLLAGCMITTGLGGAVGGALAIYRALEIAVVTGKALSPREQSG